MIDAATSRAPARAKWTCRAAVCLGMAAAVALPTPAAATSCRQLDPETAISDFASICWQGLHDRQLFDEARNRSASRFRPLDGLTRFAGNVALLEYDVGRSCTLHLYLPKRTNVAEQIVAGISRELGLPLPQSHFDSVATSRAYAWPTAERGPRRIEATLRFLPRGGPMSCSFDEMRITVQSLASE